MWNDTKGLRGADLAALIARVPAVALGGVVDRSLLGRLERGELTFDTALQEDAPAALAQLANGDNEPNRADGERLCRTLDALPACAAAPRGW